MLLNHNYLIMKIEITTNPSKSDAKTISQGIVDYNKITANVSDCDDEMKFSVFARNDENEIIGGLRAICYWNTLHIELLWLDENYRGTGMGTTLLERAEVFARKSRYENALVETTSWQAKPFYEKHGYQLQNTINDRPKGHKSYYLSKIL